jgi:uncharacterized membrane protein YbhN (UPF0104 family)
MAEAATGGQEAATPMATGSRPSRDPGTGAAQDPVTPAAGGTSRWSGRSWRAIFFAPVGDGRRRRRGSDAFRAGISVVVVLVCWLATRINPSSEKALIAILASPPDGIKWLVTSVAWVGSVGLIVAVVVLALVSRRTEVVRDVVLAGAGAWLVCVGLSVWFGPDGGRPPATAPHGFDLAFPVARVAAAVAVAAAAMPYLSRWVQRTILVTIGLLAVATMVSGYGLPVAVLASLAIGVLLTAVVHLVFGSPLGLASAAEVRVLLTDLGIVVDEVAPSAQQSWGLGRFSATQDGSRLDISYYGRDASDAQLLSKTTRFLLYRDSGPTLTYTRRQQVEHEAYLTLMADRAGARVATVLAAGPAGPAKDALLVTRPPEGRRLAELAPFVLPTVAAPDAADTGDAGAASAGSTDIRPDGIGPDGSGPDDIRLDGAASTHAAPTDAASTDAPPVDPVTTDAPPVDPVLTDEALDGIYGQVLALRSAGIAHGALSTETIVLTDDGTAGLVDMRSAATVATTDQLDRDLAATMAAAALVAGPDQAAAAAARTVPTEALVAALPYLQRAALDPVASRTLRGKKALLAQLREAGAQAVGIDVPKLIEPRRISWVNLVLVVGTLIGGWALIGVLVNVTHSWSTITGARWGWVAAVFVLAQAVYPALAVTTVGSVTDTMPYGRTVALEVSNTFVSLAGGTMGALATRVRFFQQQGYDATLAVSSGVLISTASWIVKGGLFVIAIPIAISQFHFGDAPTDTGGGSGSSTATLVWIIVIAVAALGILLGLLFAIPRWRRLAAAKLRPKASEVWGHLRLLSTHPRNLVEIFGGEIVGQLLVALALGAALHAFDERLSLASLLIALTLGSMIGGISPVPGGMGVVEAGMILALTAAGIPEDDAVAAVFVQRLFTAYLPPIWGWFFLVWMRRKEYL